MKKFRVTLYYHTNCTVEVEAENESDAVQKAYQIDVENQLIEGLQEDDSPDVIEVKE